ncbi:MAG: tetrahydromethanopterin S-methyltransferase subunit D [Candidatus Methanomethylicota archaeon]|uniref:Tetrahydromethanopterin S-methyltransferase subunit D n=1 Tax=Thermoproteota archaeon TaxID=2056631 RepID=A0A497F2S6_9CREN|nr:MAG: tetrahydromethanopterin S-methyltransferase subunit D [Candidatus Verstraetearchaeota archaeon]
MFIGGFELIDPLILILAALIIAVAGVLISVGTILLPIGGAPAAMATATGIATGTEMMLAGSGITGLLMAAALYNQPGWIIILNAGISSAIMMSVVMLIANVLIVLGKGIPPALAMRDKDPITKEDVKQYVTPGTVGHGVPTACFLDGMVGAFIAGVGGSITFLTVFKLATFKMVLGKEQINILEIFSPLVGIAPHQVIIPIALAVLVSLGLFFINANITAYMIKGVIEGWWDPKFKDLPKAAITCFIVTLVFGVLVSLIAL